MLQDMRFLCGHFDSIRQVWRLEDLFRWKLPILHVFVLIVAVEPDVHGTLVASWP